MAVIILFSLNVCTLALFVLRIISKCEPITVSQYISNIWLILLDQVKKWYISLLCEVNTRIQHSKQSIYMVKAFSKFLALSSWVENYTLMICSSGLTWKLQTSFTNQYLYNISAVPVNNPV